MQNIIKIGIVSIFVVLLGVSCTGNFDDINTSKDMPEVGDIDRDYLWASLITTMQRNVYPETANSFQLTQDILGNAYAGYFAQTNNWEGGLNATTYYFTAKYTNEPFRVAYNDCLPSWNILRQKVDSTSVTFAVGEIVKVQAMHRCTDMYGPLPYLSFGKVSADVPYDSQKAIYESFFKELDHAIEILTKSYNATPTAKPLAKFDLIYGSDLGKWVKFANSLKLRLAMRIRYVDPTNAKIYAEQAMVHPIGVILTNEDNAVMHSNAPLGYTYNNPIEYLWGEYMDNRMGATMESYLKGYKDPRLSKYFQPTSWDKDYHGARLGTNYPEDYREAASSPAIYFDTPLRWMVASEVDFLRAEGAMLGWAMGADVAQLYKDGVTKSFELWNAGSATTYLNNSTAMPAAFEDPADLFSNNIASPSTITIKWNDTATDAVKLERIITQKWLAIYPEGQESWSEFRRTGYPKIFPVMRNNSGSKSISTDIQIRRIPFPESEYLGNTVSVAKAVSEYLGGPDTGGTKLWWDARK